MNPFNIFGKKTKEDTAGKDKWVNDRRALEIYSGMRVVVKDEKEQVLFIAKLQDPEGRRAELYQYSDTEIQGTGRDASVTKEGESLAVKIRGYNDHKQIAVFMEGMITPKERHIWQVEDLLVTKIENERSFSRMETDIDAVITIPGEADREEVACKLLNISVGGVSVRSGHRYYKGDRFILKVRLLEEGSISTLYCEVLRVIEKERDRFEYGCQFLELSQAAQKEISQKMSENVEW